MTSYPLLNTLKDGLSDYRVASRSPTAFGETFSPSAAPTPIPTPLATTGSPTVTVSTSADPNCSGSWVSHQSNVPDSWCVTICAADPVWCLAYCECSSTDEPKPSTTAKPDSTTQNP